MRLQRAKMNENDENNIKLTIFGKIVFEGSDFFGGECFLKRIEETLLRAVWDLGFWNLIPKNLIYFFSAQKPIFFLNLIFF